MICLIQWIAHIQRTVLIPLDQTIHIDRVYHSEILIELPSVNRTFLDPYGSIRIKRVTKEVTYHEIRVTCRKVSRQVTVQPSSVSLQGTEPSFRIIRVCKPVQRLSGPWVPVYGKHVFFAGSLYDHLMLLQVLWQYLVRYPYSIP